jgi:hypothetical protein
VASALAITLRELVSSPGVGAIAVNDPALTAELVDVAELCVNRAVSFQNRASDKIGVQPQSHKMPDESVNPRPRRRLQGKPAGFFRGASAGYREP